MTVFLISGPAAEAQPPKKIPRIGYLYSGGQGSDPGRAEYIRLALRELGYIEGQNIATEYRYGEGKRDRLPDLAADLVRLQVDLILAASGEATIRALMNATKTVPIVLAGIGLDPIEAGLVKSLARPGGNVTGVTSLGRELGGKRLELLKEVVPKLGSIAVLYEPASPPSVFEVKEILPATAHALGLTVRSWEVRDAAGLEKVFVSLSHARPDGLYVPGGPLLSANQKRTVRFALESRLPSIYSNGPAVDAGGLMYYGADRADSYRRVAYFVDKILKGANLPICRSSSRRSSSWCSISKPRSSSALRYLQTF